MRLGMRMRDAACACLVHRARLAGSRCHLVATVGFCACNTVFLPTKLQPSDRFSREELHDLPPKAPE